jgi:signal transduction histidine kinase
VSTTRELEARLSALRMPAGAVLTGATRVMLLSILISLGVLLAVPVLQAPAAPAVLLLTLPLVGMVWALGRTAMLQRDLRQARVRALDATDLERRRIQRDLHDSAQQRLVSVRIQLGLLAERAESDDDRASIDKLGRGLEDALADIRSVTRDGAPRTLAGFGVAQALRSVAAQAALPVTIDADGFDRYPPEIERAIYYSCVEALQNSVKHGGPNAVVRIGLRGSPSGVSFIVEDSGVGFVAGRARSGAGLQNLADRVGALGGRLTVDSNVGTGTRIRGEIPLRTRTAMTV